MIATRASMNSMEKSSLTKNEIKDKIQDNQHLDHIHQHFGQAEGQEEEIMAENNQPDLGEIGSKAIIAQGEGFQGFNVEQQY